MCQFIVAFVQESARPALLSVTKKLTLSPIENRHLKPWLLVGERIFSTTTSQCDCDTFFGTRRTSGRPLDDTTRGEREAWQAFLDVAMKATPSLGLFLHTYSGPLSGRVSPTRVVEVKRSLVDDAFLARIEEDVVYRVVRDPKTRHVRR